MGEQRDQFEIIAHPQNAAHARTRVRAFAAAAGMAEDGLDEMEVAVGEAVTNAILYGSPSAASRVFIACRVQADLLEIEVWDQGGGFDPASVHDGISQNALGGRGLLLMRALMDDVRFQHDGQGTRVTLARRVSP